MKKMMLVIGAVLAVAIVSPAGADFVETFEGAGYVSQQPLPAPWVHPTQYPMVVNLSGYNAPGSPSQGTHANSPNWHESRRASGQTSATLPLELTLKALLSSRNGLARHQWGLRSGGSALIWEMHGGDNKMYTPTATPVSIARDTWYEVKITINQTAGTYTTEWGLVGGLGVVEGPLALPAGFVVDTVMLGGIWAFDEGDPFNSAMDDVAFATVPEPITMSLLAFGGLLAIRRRR